jgi:hypothetical protein
MPFDGVGFASDDLVSKMDQVISLLATPDKWCKGSYRTPDGRYCIRGAMMAVDGADCLRPIVLQAIREVTGTSYRRIESFNDHRRTHHTQVLRVLARARRHLLAGQSPGPCSSVPEVTWWGARLRTLLNGFAAKKAA